MAHRSIRFRITAVAAVVVAAVLVIAACALVVLQRDALTDTIDQALTQRANDVEALLEEGGAPQQFKGSTAEGFVQLVGSDGMVIVSTPNLTGEPPLNIASTSGGDALQTIDGLSVDDDAFRVLSRAYDGGFLHVGTTFDVITESTNALVGSLAVTIPVVLLILAGLVWWLVGRTLRPVERIRATVASITATHLDQRVPQPGTQDEIDQLATTMNQMLERLESSTERQQRFVADASHELRSPLTRLRTQVEVDIASLGDEHDRQPYESLLVDVVAMQAMVEDLLYLAQADSATVAHNAAPLDLDDLVLREGQSIAANGRVQVDLSEVSGAHVLGDRSQLGRATKNLMENAERHATGRVSVGLQETNGMAVLTVTDDGPGINAPDANVVFERFGRLEEARGGDTGGTGLGLAITREIADRHGGSLALLNPGKPGASFEMRIPLNDG